MTRELPLNRFHSKSFYVLRDIIIYLLTFLLFLFYVVFLTTIFPSPVDLLILQTSLLLHWSLPPILVHTISSEHRKIRAKQQRVHKEMNQYIRSIPTGGGF